MSETDSFIQEVTEEVRQDRMFALWKKWGPYVLVAIALVVGGSAFWSWMQARERAQAEARGAALLAVEPDSLEAQQKLARTLDPPARLVAEFTAAADLARAGKTDEAVTQYRQIAARGDLAASYRQLAQLEAIRLEAPTADPQAALAKLRPLMAADAPYALLARELAAALQLEAGDTQAAHEALKAIITDPRATRNMRIRARELLTATGGSLEEKAS